VDQLSENSVKIKWLVPDRGKFLLIRYRIQLSVDNFVFDIREWPGIVFSYIKYTTKVYIEYTI